MFMIVAMIKYVLIGHSRPIYLLFSSLQTNITIFTTNVKNVHAVYGPGIWTHNLQNLSLLPLTTRPGLPP